MSARTPLPCWIAIVALACSDSPVDPGAPPSPPVPPLEAVSFDQLGSGRVVFARMAIGSEGDGVYVIDPASRQTWSSPLQALQPSVSPDGRRMAFLESSGMLASAYDVYVANLDGTDVQRVATFDGNVEGPPSWTPNGTQIMYVVNGHLDVSIYRQSPIPSAADRAVIRTFTRSSDGPPVCPFTERSNGPIAVSLDGAVAFNCVGREIDVMQPDGHVTAAYTAPPPGAGILSVLHAPAWSPVGDRLAFLEEFYRADDYQTLGTSVIVVDVARGTSTVLATVTTNGKSNVAVVIDQFSLCWLSSGSGIVFTAPDGWDAAHLFVAGIPSGAVTRMTSAPNVLDHSVSCQR